MWHTVQEGEHICGIADTAGFRRLETVWNHEENTELREIRPNPHVLAPGDLLFVPDRESRSEQAATETRHRYRLRGEPLHLKVVLHSVAGTLLRNAEVVVWIDGVSRQLTTDAEGQLKVTIPRRAREGRIVVEAMEGLPEGLKAELRVGGLDPVSHLRGQVQRLHNLGFLTWNLEPDAISTPKDQSFLMAVEKFQHKHKLQVDGICGRRTQAKLLEVHGS